VNRLWRRWLPDVRTAMALAGELIAYVATALAMLWPLTFALGSHIAGWLDARYYAWANWRAGEMLASGDLTLRIREIVWPYGIDIRHLDGQLPTLIGGFWNLAASPELAHNLGLLTGIGLNLWAGRRLGKACSDHRPAWALTALAFATAPAVAARLEVHFTMLFVFPLALLMEEAVRVGRGDHPIRPIRLGVLLFVAYLCGIYILIFGGIAFAIVVLLATEPRQLPPLLLRSTAGLLIALALLSPFLLARLQLDGAERAAGRDPTQLSNTFIAGADGLALATQPVSSTLQFPGMERMRQHFRTNIHESTIFPGFLLLFSVGGLLLLVSPLRWPLLVTALALWLFTFGTSIKIDGRFVLEGIDGKPVAWLPYTAFFEIPGLAGLRSPNRASFALTAVLATAAATCLGWLFTRYDRPWQQAAMTVGGGALLVTNLLVPIHQQSIVSSPALGAALASVADRVRPGESMIGVPAECRDQSPLVMQILYRAPLVGCQASPAAIPWQSDLEAYKRSAAYAALRCAPGLIGGRVRVPFDRGEGFDRSDLDSLRDVLGARFFLIDRKRLALPRCAHVREAVDVLARFDTVGGDRLWTVIDTGPIGRSAPN
jgi:hypothetical protein